MLTPPHLLARLGPTARWLISLLVVLPTVGASAAAPQAASPAAAEWRFIVRLDDKPIGTHRFVLQPQGPAQQLTSVADFKVTLLGITAYRYRHDLQEQWRDECLASLTARTDDDGQVTQVRGQAGAGGFAIGVQPPGASTAVQTNTQGCLMSFAYWHPELARQTRLLDPGTGRVQPVQVSELPATTLDVRGQPTTVRGLRIRGLPQPIDVWYAGSDWVGLDTWVKGGRQLSYRLQ